MIEIKFIIMQYWIFIVIYIVKENYNKVVVYLIYLIESLVVEIKLRSLYIQFLLKKNVFWLNYICWYQRKIVIKVIYFICCVVYLF